MAPVLSLALLGGCSLAQPQDCPVAEAGLSETRIMTDRYAGFYDLFIQDDGSSVVAGSIESNSVNLLGLRYDAYVLKSNASGDVQWSKTWNWGPYSEWSAIEASGDGGYYLAGITGVSSGFLIEELDTVIAKIDGLGEEVWSHVIQSDIDNSASSLVVNSDGTFIVAGREGSSASLAKFGAAGNEIWRRLYERSSAFSVVASADGGYAFSGQSGDYLGVFKTDADGVLQWRFDGADASEFDFTYASGMEIVETRDGGYAVVCSIFDEDYGYHLVVVKLDSAGGYLWGAVAPGVSDAPYTYGYALLERSDGSLVAGGQSYAFHPVFSSLARCYRYYGVRLGEDGQVLWSARLGEFGSGANAIDINPDGQVVFAGTDVEENGDSFVYLLTSDAGG